MEDFSKISEEMKIMKSRLDKYELDFCNKSDAGSAGGASIVSDSDSQQKELQALQTAFTQLKAVVDSAIERVSAVEKKADDLEQYGRSNCLIVHGCQDVPKSGKFLETENFVCSTLNAHLKLDTPLQIGDLDIAHPIPAKKGTSIIIKFLRRFQRNEIYAKKKSLKNTGLVITESLTKRRLKLLEAARKAFGVRSTWTMRGEIFVFYNNKRLLINDFIDINKIKNLPTYAAVANGGN